MAQHGDVPAWIALFVGLYIVAASLGELRQSGGWLALLNDLERSQSTRFLSGAFALAIGAAIYLVSPWRPEDWLSVLVSIIGGLAVAKGMALLMFADKLTGFARRVLGARTQAIAGINAALGALLTFAALARLPASG